MSQCEDLVIVESTDYAQVVFDDVRESYSLSKPLECLFTLNDLIKPDEADWIGIYKVGFSNCTDHSTILKIKLDAVNEGKGRLTFQLDSLPIEEGEFYQFVYVSLGKQIRGASVPFQFKRGELNEFVEEDEEQDAIVIKYEVNETINEVKSRCSQLAKANVTYEKQIKENEEFVKSLKEEVASIKLKCFKLTMDNEKLNFTLSNKAEDLKNVANTISTLNNENSKLQTKFEEISAENKSLMESLQQRIDQVTQLKNDLENVRLSSFELVEANLKVESQSNIIKDLTEKLAQSELEKSEFYEKMTQVKMECEKKNEQTNGSLFALRMAQTALETRFKQSEQKRELAEKENEANKKAIEHFFQENEELKERIKAGAKEYSKLFDKYRLLKNQQFNNDINIYHDLSSGDILMPRKFTPRISMCSEDQDVDSAMQDKSMSQSMRGLNSERNTTFLDEIFGTSLYDTTWNRETVGKNFNLPNKLTTGIANPPATITQPKSQNQTSDLSDDGLMNLRNNRPNGQYVQVETPNMNLNRAAPYRPANMICQVCSHVFPTDASQFEIDTHYESHYGPSCPVCFFRFEKSYNIKDFEQHVNSHFSN